MSVWICGECTAAYSVDAPRCPQCGDNQPIKEGEQLMPKITVHGGASNADDAEVAAAADETEQNEAQTLEVSPEDAEQEGEPTEVVDYNAFTVDELKAELKDRGLPVSGKHDELVVRLAEDDGAKLQGTE